MKSSDRDAMWVTDCPTGKRGYITRNGAKGSARRLKQEGERQLGVYRCEHCDRHHVGHRPAAVARGIISVDQWQDSVKRRTA